MSWPSPCGPHPAFSVGLDPYQPTCATAGKCLKVNRKQQNNRYHKRCQNDSFRSCGHLVPVTKPGASLFARWQRVTLLLAAPLASGSFCGCQKERVFAHGFLPRPQHVSMQPLAPGDHTTAMLILLGPQSLLGMVLRALLLLSLVIQKWVLGRGIHGDIGIVLHERNSALPNFILN